MWLSFLQGVIQGRANKCLLVLRVGDAFFPTEGSKFLAPPTPDGLDELLGPNSGNVLHAVAE